VTEVAKIEVASLTGPQKAAAILLTLGRPAATQIMRKFTPQELRLVTLAAARLGPIAAGDIDALVEEFGRAFSDGATMLGGEAQARQLVTDAAPPDQIAEILADLGGLEIKDVWKAAANLADALIAGFLKDERPVLVTFILSRLDSSAAARIVALLPRELRNEVLVRLLAPPTVGRGALTIVEDALRRTLLGGAATGAGDEARARIADIVNNLTPEDAEDVMRALGASRPQDAKIVRKMLFAFDDLTRLSQRARALLFDKLSTEVVVLALRGTEQAFREPVLSAMASRSRRLVESELAQPAAAPPPEIEKARRQIVKLVLVMAQRGELELPSDEETEAA